MIRKIKYWFKRKWSQIKRVIDFLPLIWKGYDWDYHYAIELFQYQLKRIADHIGSDKAWALENKQTASRIRTAIELMDKVYNEEYGIGYMDIIEEKYGKSHMDFVEVDKKDENGRPDYSLVLTNELARDEEHQKEIDEERRLLVLEYRDKQKRAHKILWDFIEYNIPKSNINALYSLW